MSKYLAIVFLIAIIGIIMTYQNCAKPANPGQAAMGGQVSLMGTVKNIDLENCGKVIVSDSDKTSTFLVNANLLKDIPVQTHVAVQGQVDNESVTNCMVGVNLKVDKLEVVQ